MTAGTDRKRVLLARPRGYCAGVDRAVQAVEETDQVPEGARVIFSAHGRARGATAPIR